MKIAKEVVDDEYYIDITLSENELESLQERFLIAEPFNLFGHQFNIGIQIDMKEKYAS